VKPVRKKRGRPFKDKPEPLVTLSIRIPVPLNEEIEMRAEHNNRSKSAEIVTTLEKHYLGKTEM
jgi:hypothetical protein